MILDSGVYARYMLQNLLVQTRYGVDFVCFYTMHDPYYRAEAIERHFGMYEWTGSTFTPKSVVSPFGRLMAALADTASDARTFDPGSMNISLSNLGSVYTPAGLPWGYTPKRPVEELWLRHRQRNSLIGLFAVTSTEMTVEKTNNADENSYQFTAFTRPGERTVSIQLPDRTSLSGLRRHAPFEADGWTTGSSKITVSGNTAQFTISDEVSAIEIPLAA